MAEAHYKTRILPDGHLPLPDGFPATAGQEVEVTVTAGPATDKVDGWDTVEYLLQKWAGCVRGSGEGVAERHDDFLYGR